MILYVNNIYIIILFRMELKKQMNVIEAYIKYKTQLIIFISGLSGCKKTFLAKKLSDNLKINFIDQFNYYKKNYKEKIELLTD